MSLRKKRRQPPTELLDLPADPIPDPLPATPLPREATVNSNHNAALAEHLELVRTVRDNAEPDTIIEAMDAEQFIARTGAPNVNPTE